MSDTLKRLERESADAKQAALDVLLAQCTDSQREKFNRIFPNGPGDRIDAAIRLCERTVAKNKIETGKEEPS